MPRRVLPAAACVLLAAACSEGPPPCPGGQGLGQWQSTSRVAAPAQRHGHAFFSTPGGVVVWGGRGEDGLLADGARHDVATDTWTPLSTEGAPAPREHFAWATAGPTLLVLGGRDAEGKLLGDAHLYDVTLDRWHALELPDAPAPRMLAAAAGVQSVDAVHFYVVGGHGERGPLTDLYRLDVLETSARWWRVDASMPLRQPAPGRSFNTQPVSLFIDPMTFMPIVFSGLGVDGNSARVAVFDLVQGEWVLDPANPALSSRLGASAVFNGTELFIYGGHDPAREVGEDPRAYRNDGARLDVALVAGRLRALKLFDGPAGEAMPRAYHAAQATGDGMLVVGGVDPGYCGGGAFFDAFSERWERLDVAGGPASARLPAATWVPAPPNADGGPGVGGRLQVFGGHRPASLMHTAPFSAWWVP